MSSKRPHSSLGRRDFARLGLVAPFLSLGPACDGLAYEGGLTSIDGIRIGHDTLEGTGCTVVLTEAGATAAVDVRGAAPGTRETDLLNPVNSVDRVQAILLSGGSAFGLDAATGVVRYLEEKGLGYKTRHAPVPIVPAAILYDLGIGDPQIRPDQASGYRACLQASSGPVREGNVGAGTGATVGKTFGMDRAMKAGIGSSSVKVGDLTVAALAAVNAVGDIVDPRSGKLVAGARSSDGRSLINTMSQILDGKVGAPAARMQNTTLVVVATNARLNKTELTKVAQMSHDGFARAINPVHTPSDGDTVFALSTGEPVDARLGLVGILAAEAASRAIVRAALTAAGIKGFPAACDL